MKREVSTSQVNYIDSNGEHEITMGTTIQFKNLLLPPQSLQNLFLLANGFWSHVFYPILIVAAAIFIAVILTLILVLKSQSEFWGNRCEPESSLIQRLTFPTSLELRLLHVW